MPRPTLFLLHTRDTPAGAWDGVVDALDDRFDVVVLALPGGADDAAGVAAEVREREPDEWFLAAAAEAAAAATRVASWAEQGEHGLIAAAGVVLVGAAGAAAGALRRTPVRVVEGDAEQLLREQPGEVSRTVEAFAAEVGGRAALPPAFARLIASDRVSARTRRAMLARLDEPGESPRALSAAQRTLLAAVLARVVPQRGTDIDLAARIDAGLGAGRGDGWRFAELPPDAEAWRRGLDTIAAEVPGFAALDVAAQDAAVDRIAAGAVGSDEDGLLTGARMARWFADVQAEAVRTWASHPAVQAWLRYDGFADGGDGDAKKGFTTTHAGEWETWQRDWRTGKELQA